MKACHAPSWVPQKKKKVTHVSDKLHLLSDWGKVGNIYNMAIHYEL
jgi:hypothetical protein